MDNKSLSHTRWKCQYHIVFIPKYRKKVLYGRIRRDVREIIATLCQYKNVEIIAGAVCIDHVHLSVAIPPKLRVSDFMGYLKGKSTLMVSAKYSCGFSNPQISPIIATDRYLDYFTTIMEDRLWQVLA